MTYFPRQLFRRGIFGASLSLVLLLPALAEEATLVVTRLDGTQLRGELADWNAAELTLQTDGQPVAIASSQLLRAQWQNKSASEPADGIFIDLVDGTRLPHVAFHVQQGQAILSTPLAEEPLTLSTDRIGYVQLTLDAPERDQLDPELAGDMLVVRKKKTGSFDNLSGLLGDVSSEQVEFTWDGESIPVKRSKIAALAYFHARVPVTKDPVCWLNLHGGARLPVTEISIKDQTIQVQTSSGLAFSFPLQSLQEADYSQGKIVYLSDLKPLEQRWTPRIGLPESAELIQQHGLPRRDQSFAGSALTLHWPAKESGSFDQDLQSYDKGLAVRSRTVIRYRVPRGMRRFVTIAGIDPETISQGNVTLEIFAGPQSIWQGEIDGSSAPTEINVELGDARELRIVVGYGANLDFGDRLHLAEARVSQ